ncbi:MAG: GreA/GreB family elongation factor [Betaproteobacteria bacterium]|nr:GreA/GreB family elongation factor [Betaproteobacteria bacterium]MBK7080262.1 GreA/GreB family elongation factor [Betaproteobacteria bacterium]MBK7744878.1 GreA/GreB family elongation factor [Betaproteobacteria bacterium]MBK8687753.1 GreA/GreB family elongation factor [Betaproteobacteria bacterium]MBK9676122.1 GreA/GreB family elongation factor [Betaproteobacteria bacterium]
MDDVNRHLFLTERDFIRVMALQPGPALRAELERAIVVPADAIPAGVVTMYAQVRYYDEHAGVTRRVRIVLPEDADVERGDVSVLAPVGAALLGLEAGQAIDWRFPAGEIRRLRVEEVLGEAAIA